VSVCNSPNPINQEEVSKMISSTPFESFMKTFYPFVPFFDKEKELVSYFERSQPCFLDEEKTNESATLLYYYVLAKIGTSCSPQTVIILTKNESRPMTLRAFKGFIDDSRFGRITKESSSINFVDSCISTLQSKIFVKSSIQSLIGMKADLVIVGKEFEDQFYDLIPHIHASEVIFKFPKPEEKIEENVNFFDITREESFSSGLYENVSELISKIGRTNLSELIFFVLEEGRSKNDCFFEHDFHTFLQKLELVNFLDDLYISKRTSRLFSKFKIYQIVECFKELFPSWDKFLTSQNLKQYQDQAYVGSFVLEQYLLTMKRYLEENSIIHPVGKTNHSHTQCQVAFNKVFFSNLDKIFRELEKNNE
jgi:hypothetical protein